MHYSPIQGGKMEICIATARIDLGQKMNRFKHYEVWLWNLTFFDSSNIRFSNLLVELPTNKKAAKKRKEEIKSNFKKIGIKSGSLVGILFNRKSHEIIAIDSSGKRLLVNVDNDFALEELDLDVTYIKFFFD